MIDDRDSLENFDTVDDSLELLTSTDTTATLIDTFIEEVIQFGLSEFIDHLER